MANNRLKVKSKRPAVKAAQKIRDDVRRGKRTKPSKCSRCGSSPGKSKLQGHHNKGYTNKTSVQFLCAKCHSAANARTKGQKVNRHK